MTASPLALGLVGCGRLAEAGYLPALGTCPGVRLVAVADPDPARCTRVAALAAALAGSAPATFAGARSLLDQAGVDAVVLATPAATHVADAALAASAGVAVLVEKPPAPDGAGARALARAAPGAWVGFNRRFDPGARSARATVPSGDPVHLRLALSYRRRSWRAHQVRDDALGDLGPHLVDWARWLTGSEAVEVSGAEVGPERATFELALTSGRATIRVATDRPHRELIEVRDGAGTVLGRHRLGGPVAAVRGRIEGQLGGRAAGAARPSPLVASLAAQLAAFARAVVGEVHPDLATVADGHAAMAVVDAARASASGGGRPVPVSALVDS